MERVKITQKIFQPVTRFCCGELGGAGSLGAEVLWVVYGVLVGSGVAGGVVGGARMVGAGEPSSATTARVRLERKVRTGRA